MIVIKSPTVIASIIALSGTILSALLNAFLTHRINKKNNEVQESLLQDRIRADIISTNRIKRIEELKKSTVDYINSFVELVRENNKKNNSDYDNSKKLKFMQCSFNLMLYFSDRHGDIEDSEIRNNYLLNDLTKKYSKLQKTHRIDKLYNESIQDLTGEDENDFLNSLKSYITNEKTNKNKSKFISILLTIYHNSILKHNLNNSEADDIINTLIDVVATYSKIEWDRVKNNE